MLGSGSSPLTRGKLDGLGDHGLDRGLIPAHAGKTTSRSTATLTATAHPRSRGENQDENIVNLSKQGSSPLTRGKPKLVHCYVTVAGLIPAHAGKTASGRTAAT